MEHDPFMLPLEEDFGLPQQDNPPEPEQLPPPEIPQEQPLEIPPETPPMPSVFEQDYQRMMALPPISRLEAESCRHSHEKRWYRRLILLNFLTIAFVLLTVISNTDTYREKLTELSEHITGEVLDTMFESEDSDSDETAEDEDAEQTDEEGSKKDEDDDYFNDFVEDFPTELRLLGYGIVLLIFGYLGLFMTLAQVKASSVKITLNNFPEVYQLIFSYAQRLGMEKVPDAYIMQQSGVLNAFSAFIPHRQYIMINTEVFEVAYREHQDLNALSFIIAHEVSHIYYGHATLHYNLPIWFSMNFPLFGQIASRTREYSCDRLAQRLTNYDGLDAMLMLMVDRHLYKMIDKQDYVDQTLNERGFFLWLVNLISTHPIMPKRIRALVRWSGSGELY